MNIIERIRNQIRPRSYPIQQQPQRPSPAEIDQLRIQQQMRQPQQQPQNTGRFSVPREKQILSAYRTNNVLSSTQPQPQNYPQQRQTLTLVQGTPLAPRLKWWY